ncbi:M14 family metallopeptidase [Pseudoalteromonas fenneropenaei]|uniref:M14 family metallopeptidase n=1 Tax=Pseudoalteromonas fenneropenaei TaxID=1737459 RepID=A0ABV7CFE1_9GAMM
MFASLLLMTAGIVSDSHLPPLMEWHGKSGSLLQQQGPLTTDFELSNGLASPDYQQTMAFVDRLVAANPTQFKRVSIGKSDAGRDIVMLIASEQSPFTAPMLRNNGKPTLLIHAGIHAGEIDGKDAGFMLLRDIATGKRRDILSKVNLLFIPILNVDGHERRSEFNRINQRGPVEMGFRTNGKNLNLNRDFTKLDTPEVRALLQVINEFAPNLYVDVHVTDGADYQYDVTYGFNPEFASESPAIARVLEEQFQPIIDKKLVEYGHLPGPFVFAMNKRDFKEGLAGWVATPRYSNGWADLRGLPAILVENHSLKPYRQRVLGTYAFFDGVIEALATQGEELETAVKNEAAFVPTRLVVERGYSKTPDYTEFKGIAYKKYDSALSGQTEVKYLGEPLNYEKLPIYWQKEVKKEVSVPAHFYIPPVYSALVAKLKLHGVEVTQLGDKHQRSERERLKQAKVEQYEFAKAPFEGRFRVSATFSYHKVDKVSLAGWYAVDLKQTHAELATHLLHPEAPDSFFAWGEFNTIFQLTEYVENYALEPYARTMLKDNPKLALEFDRKVREESTFAKSPEKRLEWLYQQTPYYDAAYLKYPILFGVEE